MTVLVRVLVAGMVALALASCSESTEPGPVLPPRPTSVPADRVAPCAMLTPPQADRLQLYESQPGGGVVDGRPSPGCTWLGSNIGYNIQFIPVGAEAAIPVPGSTITQVNGFGAVQNSPVISGAPPICQLAVDIAPGQTVRVQANAVPDPPYGMDELCRRARETASMVVDTVVATAPR